MFTQTVTRALSRLGLDRARSGLASASAYAYAAYMVFDCLYVNGFPYSNRLLEDSAGPLGACNTLSMLML